MGRARRPTDRINIVDIESTCWDANPPQKQFPEIIQIGIAQVDLKELRIVDSGSIYVQPANSSVSEFCTQLTGITQEKLDKDGLKFHKACDLMKKHYATKKYPWGSYGDYDRNQFLADCKSMNYDYPFGRRHLNVKTLIAMANGWDGELGMDGALKELKMPLEGRHHDGGDDAKNIAKLFIRVMRGCRK